MINFYMTFSPENKDLADLVSRTLGSKMNGIAAFFGLDGIDHCQKIIIYSTAEEYKAHAQQFTEYYSWMIGDTYDGNINLLSLLRCREAQGHENMTEEDYIKLILHEFTHICQQQINPSADGVIWFWEALAQNLSGQTNEDIEITCSPKELSEDYINLFGNYAISCKLGRYMLHNLPHERIMEYVRYPEKLTADLPNIISEAQKTERTARK
ncbi:MAG: hypothetical protein PUI48_07695 [Oscillospiraceae bacterium]|nr:hypothetical protein [Oscillospiraceae bacterium]MDY6207729.1 hypothetical protein [Oscillospiraceae bacterium]